jgi:hypothetical protein
VHIVETFGLCAGKMNLLHGSNTEAFFNQSIDDFAGVAGLDSIGL